VTINTAGPPHEESGEEPPRPTSIETRRADPVDLSLRDDITRPHRREDLIAPTPVHPGAKIGRFRIGRQLGEGGMGLIFAAHDDELDREVALKILRPRERGGALSRARMIREAQALAKLSHPNVVTVYEVGEHEGHVFIAMELVKGTTLRSWLKVHTAQKTPRLRRAPWRAIITVFAAAGRGLAAAHNAGIIHRDFKPTNVIVGVNRHVTVLDFGIAIAPGRADTGPLTLAGTISGTPPYMAPEQVAGAPVDPRADQYAYAACLYEALVGERPYKGTTLDERLRELLTEPPPSFPKGSRLPTWLQRAVLRGLAQDPDLRFASMQAFITAIERDPRRPLRRGALVGVAAITLAATGYAVAYNQVAPDPICASGDREIADAWDPARKEAVTQALAATDVSYADDTLRRLVPLLDGYRDDWVRARQEACEANLRGDLPTDLYGLEIACLTQRRRSFAALTTSLAQADVSAAEQALAAARDLPALRTCADVAALTSAVPPPEDPAVGTEVRDLRLRLDAERVELSLGHFDDALAELGAICDRADELDYLPLRAEAHTLRGLGLLRDGEAKQAEDALRPALWWADELRDDRTLATAMAGVLRSLDEQARLDEALTWIPHLRAVLARLGSDPRAAELSRDLGWIYYRRREAAAALSWLDRAKELAEGLSDPQAELLLSIDARRAAVLNLQGDATASLEVSRRVLEDRIASLGAAHPAVATSLGYVGDAHAAVGDYARALPYYERALEIREAALGSDHPSLSASLGSLGRALRNVGRPADARPFFERALEISIVRLGEDHPTITEQEHSLGTLLTDLGDYEGAKSSLERSHEKIVRDSATSSIGSASSFYARGRLAHLVGERRTSIRHLQRALKIAVADPRADLSEQAPMIKALLAEVYREKKKTRRRGDRLAAEALAEYKDLDPDRFAGAIREIERWYEETPADEADTSATSPSSATSKRSKRTKSKRPKRTKKSKKSK